ncbi:hypothetical protein Tco_1207680 [Tanacetum coccineum]
MKDDLKYVLSLEDEFDDKCLILDIQTKKFKTQFESAIPHLKAQIQEKVFATAVLKNKLRKSKGNSVDTKFAKPSILRKPSLQPRRNQSVVRRPNAFKFERPNFANPRSTSQVNAKNDLSKLVTPHYLPKVRESAFAKPHHVITSSESRNSFKNMPRFSSNDMVHNHFLEEAKKKTQERDRNSKTSVMPSARLQNTTNGSKPKPRSTNQITQNWPTHKSNHDACITNLLKEVNSWGKKQSHKTSNRYIHVEKKSNAKKPERQISTGYKFSPIKSFVVYLKTTPPRSSLTWKSMGRIFTYVCLRWIPTGKTVETCLNINDSAIPLGKETCYPNIIICANSSSLNAGTSTASEPISS